MIRLQSPGTADYQYQEPPDDKSQVFSQNVAAGAVSPVIVGGAGSPQTNVTSDTIQLSQLGKYINMQWIFWKFRHF